VRIVAVCPVRDAAAVTVKDPELAPPGTCRVPGSVSIVVALVETATWSPPPGAALERPTVQVVFMFGVRVVLTHRRVEMLIGAGAMIEKATEALEEPREAVTVAF
jgi:hypothetical protein